MKRLNMVLAVFFSFFALAIPFAGAQTLYTIEGSFPHPTVGEFVGQPSGACGYPNGPVLQVFDADQVGPAGSILPFAPPPSGFQGDVAVDLDDDRVWATDGIVFSRFDADGVIDDQFVLPPGWPPMTGLGCDSESGWLWVTDGFQAAAVSNPPFGIMAIVEVPPFFLWGWPIGIAMDIEWDPCTDTLWVVTNMGELANFEIGGGPGPGGHLTVTPGPFDIAPHLTGLGIDTTHFSTTGHTCYFVTDGYKVARIQHDGEAADPTFYYPNVCEVVYPDYGPPAPLSGLAFSLRPVTYGEGSDPVGGAPVPAISAHGQSCSPNPDFGILLEDATPGSLALLALGVAYHCPPVDVLGGNPLYVDPLLFIPGGGIPVGGAGTASLPLAIPPYGCSDPEFGLVLYAQWLIQRPATAGGGFEVSEGLSFTIGVY